MRRLRTLLSITLPCAALAGALLAWPRLTGQGGWAPLEYALLAMGVAAAWAVIVLGYLLAIVLRGGVTRATAPALAVLVLASGGAGLAAWRHMAGEAACHAALALPMDLLDTASGARTARIAADARAWRDPDPCLWSALAHALREMPEDERHAVLDALLAAGLPPDQRLLHGVAITLADPMASVRLVRARATRGEPPLPEYVLGAALDRARPCQADSPGTAREVALALLRAAPGTPPPEGRGRDLVCLGWEAPAAPL